MSEHVISEVSDGVLRLVLNRPDKKNALTQAMYAALSNGIQRAESEKGIRVVHISSAGDVFTAGNDVSDFLEANGTPEESPVVEFLYAIAETNVPIVAAVNGLAVGVGVTMLLHCDFVYCAEGAWLTTPFVDLGLVPEAASSMTMPMQMGYRRAAEMLLLGDTISADQAWESGLVNNVLDADDLLEHSLVIARRLAQKPKSALRQSKALMRRDPETMHSRMQQELKAFDSALKSPEAQEAMRAFMEKRKPDFSQFD